MAGPIIEVTLFITGFALAYVGIFVFPWLSSKPATAILLYILCPTVGIAAMAITAEIGFDFGQYWLGTRAWWALLLLTATIGAMLIYRPYPKRE